MDGPLVNFRIRDCYYPEPRSILERRFGDRLLQGRVVEYVSRESRHGGEPELYAVVEVPEMKEFIIVAKQLAHPVERHDSVR